MTGDPTTDDRDRLLDDRGTFARGLFAVLAEGDARLTDPAPAARRAYAAALGELQGDHPELATDLAALDERVMELAAEAFAAGLAFAELAEGLRRALLALVGDPLREGDRPESGGLPAAAR